MRQLNFTVPPEYEGCRLKGFLRSHCQVSARLLIRLKRFPGGIKVNGAPATAVTVLHQADIVCLTLPPDGSLPVPSNTPLKVIYEDEDLLVVNKPAGMTMYPVPGSDSHTLANAAAFHWMSQGKIHRFRPIYRLDKNTSGVVVIAKNAYIAAALSHNMQKEYTAVCEGILTGNDTIRTPISLEPGSRIKRTTGQDGETAVTHWQSIRQFNSHTLLKIQLETGRTHQIRVHMASMECPLAGDDLYGGHKERINRQALHCLSVRLIHPVTQKSLTFLAPPPEDFVLLIHSQDV